MSRVCCVCHKEPIAFPTDGGDGTTGVMAYWMVIPKDTPDDPSFLMGEGDFMFAMCPDENPPDQEEVDFMCIDCFGKIYG